MKKTISFFPLVFFLLIATINAQEKTPVAEDDFAQVLALQQTIIPVLSNDYSYQNHPIKIIQVHSTENASVNFNDSLVFYTANKYFKGIDSITYRIIDLENNLLSEIATVTIEVENKGFEYINVNKVRCLINSCGPQFWNMKNLNVFEVPKGSGLITIFNKSFWVGGLTDSGKLCFAGEKYKRGEDFFQGPIMDSASYSSDQDIKWNRVWKITKAEIAYHRTHWQDTDYNPIENIKEWPGNGDQLLGQAQKLAPYYDWDADGFYDPHQGDFPIIKGDEAIFVLYNDDRNIHTESSGNKLGIEVQSLWHAYDEPEDSTLQYTIFCDSKIINRSSNNYHDLRCGHHLDFDIGEWRDDYIACDTTLHMGYGFNATPIDGDGGAGTYGNHPPAQAFTCLNHKMSSFIYYLSTGSNAAMKHPIIASEYYNYLHAYWKDSTHFTLGGTGYGGSQPINFVFPGDPVKQDGWTESTAGIPYGDRRAVVGSGSTNLASGDTLHLAFALVFARDYQGDNLSSVTLLKERVAEVRDFYQNSLSIPQQATIPIEVKIFPNPFSSWLRVDVAKNNKNLQYYVYDIIGAKVRQGELKSNEKTLLNFSELKNGLYFITMSDGQTTLTRKIIKNITKP